MNKVKVKESKIHGLGLFADQEFNEGDMIGLAHYNGVPSEIIGKYHNHSDNPNAHSVTIGNKRFLVALNPLKKGEEITVDYRQQPDLEQPEEFARGGLVSMPKPSKKGLASKRYSRDLTATNRLLTKNKLLQKPKSKKRKIYDPNAKYYEDGGELEATVQSEVPVSDPINAISAAPTFNAAFKIARSTYGPNYIFEWQGRKYGTNLTGEEFKPSEEVLAQAGLNTSTVKENLNKQNSDLNDPYSSKSTVKLEPDTYKSWDEIKQKNLELNTSANADKIINYKNSTGGDKNYIIVDKKKGLMHVYQPGNNKPLFTSPVDLGASIGDAQTVTKIKDTNGDGIIDSKEAQVGAADFDKGNKSTGAGKYYISNIDPTGYGGLPLFNMMNESQYENFLRTGKIDNVATSIHKGFIPDDNSRVSNGCIRCNKTTLDNLTKYLENSSEVYILPEDPNNEFVIENDKLNLKVKNKSPYYTYNNNGKVYKKENGSWYVAPKIGEKFVKIDQINRIKELNKNANNAGYNFYEDSNGNVQKGQGVNLGSTLNYVPIKATLDKDKFINDKFTYFDFSDSSELEVVNKFVNSLEKNKQKVMKIAKINGDVYNDIAQIAFGIFGTESNFADTHSALGNLARATQKYFDPLGSSSPDYESKYSTYGAKENSRSVGLTQIRWNYLNADEKKALKAVGINSNSDFMDPYKAALGTTLVLGIRYNQQLTDKQKKDIWNTLPKTWNTRDNYASRVLNNSKYLKLEQKVTNKNSATKRDKWGRPSTSKWYGFNPKTKKYEYQIGGEISDRRFRKELMKEYPGMQDVYGRRGQKLRITEDPNYVASQHGNFGNIEFMFPHQDPINYTEDYSYASPHPRKYNLIYNPEGANRGDMFLDMMHGMRDDENYMKLLENFNAAVKQDRGANMDKWWAVDEAEGYPDGREQWDNNYIDGVLRAELNRLDPIAATSFDAEGYAKERELNTDLIRNAAQDIYTYLKTKHKDGGELDTYPRGGGEVCPPGYRWDNAQGTCVPILKDDSDWYKLTDAQKQLLQKGNNLDVIKKWYENSPEDMEGRFKEYLDEYDAQKYLDQLDPNSEEYKRFSEALINNREWYKNWYTQRKKLPQFADVATQRLAIPDTKMQSVLADPINLSVNWWKKEDPEMPPIAFYAPEIGGITRENVARYNIDQGRYLDGDSYQPGKLLQRSYYEDPQGKLQNSLLSHEELHIRDFLAPQPNTKKNIKKSEWGKVFPLDPIETIISQEEAASDVRNRGYSGYYQQQPTEVRARLNVWRMRNGIDPLKNYTEEELKMIIDEDLKNPNLDPNIKELYETIKNDPSKLKFIHDSYVQNKSNQQLDLARYGGKPKGDEPKNKKVRFQPGTYDPNEMAGYMKEEDDVTVSAQASPWGKARIAYQERHPEEEFIERKKKQYVRQSNKGLNKIFGVNTENFNPDVEQNFRDEYDYLTNTAAVKKVSRQEGWNPNKRKEYVDDLNETQRQIVANSKYGSKLQPNYWDRGLAGLATLVAPFSSGVQRMMNEGYMPGLTKRESKEILNSKIFGIPVGGLEITTPLLAQGQALANYAKNTGLSTGSDYKEIPWFGSGESMANVSDKDVMGLDIPSLVGLGFAPEGAVNFAKGAYNLGSAGVDLAKTNPQAWFKTPEQLLQTPELYQSLSGKTSWKDPLGKLYKFTDDVKMKKSAKRENALLDALPGWENRKTRIPLQQEEQMKRFQIEKAAEARNLKRSKLPLKPVLTQHGTHLGGGQGRIYLNTLNPEEVVKVGTLPGTSEDLSNLIKAGENLEGMPFMENVAFPTNKSFPVFYEPVNNNTTAVQFMPWQGNPLDVNNPVNIPFGSGVPSDKAKRQLQYMTELLDKNKVGIDYYGQNNIMYDPSTDSFKLVDLNYVDDPKTAWEWNKTKIPVKQRIEDKFGYIPEGDLPLELEFANAKSIKPLLGNEITDNTGKFNKGVYTFKDYPQYIAKIEDPNVVAQMQGLDKEAYLNAMMERTKNLDSGRFAKVLNTIPGKNDLRVMIMPRLRGTVGSKLSPEMLNTIPDESYADFFNQLKVLRDEGLNYDFLGDNFMYDPYTEQFNLFDLSPHSARTTEPRGGNPYFFETEVFGKGNPGIYGREQAGANLKDALRKRLNRTYMETFPGDQEVYGLDEYDQRLKAIFENLSSQKYGGANSKLFRFN